MDGLEGSVQDLRFRALGCRALARSAWSYSKLDLSILLASSASSAHHILTLPDRSCLCDLDALIAIIILSGIVFNISKTRIPWTLRSLLPDATANSTPLLSGSLQALQAGLLHALNQEWITQSPIPFFGA